MKKRIALLSAFVLLVSLFSFAMMPVGATGEGKAANFFYDFTTQDNVTVLQKNGGYRVSVSNAAYEYDAVEKAAKITKTADGEANLQLKTIDASYGQEKQADYPVFAIKVKAASKAVLGGASYHRNYGGGGHGLWPAVVGNTTYNAYSDAGEWELITYALNVNSPYTVDAHATQVAGDDNWKGFNTVLATNLADFAAGETVAYVAWAGAFTTVAAAQDYFKATTRTDGDIPTEVAPVSKGDDFYFDFRTQAGCDAAEVGTYVNSYGHKGVSIANGSIAFNGTVGALEVTLGEGAADNSAQIQALRRPGTTSSSYTDYPVFAVKVKRVNAASKLGDAGYYRNIGGGLRAAWPALSSYASTEGREFSVYEDTDDWQLLIYDTRDGQYGDAAHLGATSGDDDGCWKGFYLPLAANANTDGLTAGTLAYIQWMGVFASVDDAENWFDQTQVVETPETGLIANGAGIRADLDYSVDAEKGRQGLRFNQKLITVVDAEGNQTIEDAEGNTLIVKDIFVLMGTKKNVDNLAAFDQNSANGTTILSAQVKTCRNYTFDEATNTATYEFSALLNSVPQAQRGTDISARAYLVCKNANNEEVIVLGDVQTTNVAEMYTALGGADRFSADVQAWMTEEI